MKADATAPVPELPLDIQSLMLADAAATQALGRWLARILIAPSGPGGSRITPRFGEEPAEASNTAADSVCHRPALLLLHGELGAGKTCLVQGLAEGLGIDESITSPTFALAQHYGGTLTGGRATRLVHLDLYRLEQPAAADELFSQEEEEAGGAAADGSRVVMAVEWPERLRIEPEPAWRLWLEHHGESRLARWRGPAEEPPGRPPET